MKIESNLKTGKRPLQNLAEFNASGFDRGAPKWLELMWLMTQGIFFNSWLPGSGWRCWLLKFFGAEIGVGVVIKPYVRIKFPWRLSIGHHSWIGESVWIDNLADVKIGSNVCISQGAYLCTGNHDITKASFDLVVEPICVRDHVWIGAGVFIPPGSELAEGEFIRMRRELDCQENNT